MGLLSFFAEHIPSVWSPFVVAAKRAVSTYHPTRLQTKTKKLLVVRLIQDLQGLQKMRLFQPAGAAVHLQRNWSVVCLLEWSWSNSKQSRLDKLKIINDIKETGRLTCIITYNIHNIHFNGC